MVTAPQLAMSWNFWSVNKGRMTRE